MGVNKVVLGNRTLIDLTAVTVTPEVLLDGYTAYDASGNLITGTMSGKETRLPDEYQEVEWIGSSGTQCIQIEFASDRVGACVVQQIMRTGSGVRSLIGAASAGATSVAGAAGTYFGWTTAGLWEMGGSSTTTVEASTTQFDEVKFEWYAKNSGRLTVNDTVLTSRSGSTSGGYTRFNIFGGSNYPVSCRQKEVAVYNNTDGVTETAHLVPCYRKADTVVGMYDMIGGTFLTNIGSGAFSKGADV